MGIVSEVTPAKKRSIVGIKPRVVSYPGPS